MTRLLAIVVVLCLAAKAVAVDLTYLGATKVPLTGTGTNNLAYSNGIIAVNPGGGMYIVGHEQSQVVAEITRPEPVKAQVSALRRAGFIQGPRQITTNTNGNLASNVKIGGLQVFDNQLYLSKYEFYDADANDNVSHGRLPGLNLSAKGEGLYAMGTLGQGYYGGWIATVPQELQAAIGAPMVTGQGSLSIISRTSSGPALFAFNPADYGVKNPIPAKPLLYYPLSNPLSNPEVANPLYTRADFIKGVFFLGDSVCFVGSHGTGQPRYGDGSTSGDPARSSKGEHAYPYTYQIWEYKLSDLLAVKNGTKQPWEPRPTVTSLDQYFYPNDSKYAGGCSYDSELKRLYIAQPGAEQTQYDNFPVIHVFQLNSATPPVEPPVDPPVEPTDPTIELKAQIASLQAQIAVLQGQVSTWQTAHAEAERRAVNAEEYANSLQSKIDTARAALE